MPYLFLIVEPRGQREARNESEARQAYDDMVRYGESLAEQGKLQAAQSLRPDKYGVRVQAQEGRPMLRDGPFAEAREMIGGFFMVDCASMEEAVALAAQCPAAQWATVEVREIAPCYAN